MITLIPSLVKYISINFVNKDNDKKWLSMSFTDESSQK